MEEVVANLSKDMSRAIVEDGNTSSGGFTTTSGNQSEAFPEPVGVVGPPELDNASKILKDFLLENSPEFVKVNALREKVYQHPHVYGNKTHRH